MIDQSLPSTKSLVRSFRELNTSETHITDIVDRLYEKLPEDKAMEYVQDLFNELYLDHVRHV